MDGRWACPVRLDQIGAENHTMTITTTRWSWKNEPELMARLQDAQNDDRNINRDIMTFAGLCSNREELQRHVERYERYANGGRD